ncbi:Fc.00g031790.m01.CDS01 [Cosmosporella sp. VM-42]
MAAITITAPTEIEARDGGAGGAGCNSHQKPVCCNGILGCTVQIVGSGCVSGSCCYKTMPLMNVLPFLRTYSFPDSNTNNKDTFINIQALDCVNLG